MEQLELVGWFTALRVVFLHRVGGSRNGYLFRRGVRRWVREEYGRAIYRV